MANDRMEYPFAWVLLRLLRCPYDGDAPRESIREAVESGQVDATCQNIDGMTLLMEAAIYDLPDMFELFLRFGANPFLYNSFGLSVLYYATHHRVYHSITRNAQEQIVARILELTGGALITPKVFMNSIHYMSASTINRMLKHVEIHFLRSNILNVVQKIVEREDMDLLDVLLSHCHRRISLPFVNVCPEMVWKINDHNEDFTQFVGQIRKYVNILVSPKEIGEQILDFLFVMINIYD